MAAYLWTCLDNRASLMVLGGKASGKTTGTLNVTSTILEGHRFVATSFLELTILNVDPFLKLITAVILQDARPVTGLKTENFQVENYTIISVTSNYDPQHILIYTIQCKNLESSSVTKQLKINKA